MATGRPRKEINQTEFEKLCGLQCTKEEICDWFRVTDKTLDAWCKRTYQCNFSVIFEQKRSTGKISLRRMQFKLTEKSATMAIWLGKQYLGQTDKAEIITNTITDNTRAEVAKMIEKVGEYEADKGDGS